MNSKKGPLPVALIVFITALTNCFPLLYKFEATFLRDSHRCWTRDRLKPLSSIRITKGVSWKSKFYFIQFTLLTSSIKIAIYLEKTMQFKIISFLNCNSDSWKSQKLQLVWTVSTVQFPFSIFTMAIYWIISRKIAMNILYLTFKGACKERVFGLNAISVSGHP